MMISISGLKYKDILNISKLDIDKGTQTAIIGESGSGKTTLLKLLDRLFYADEGEILYDGASIYTIPHYRRIVTMVPQHPVIFEGDVASNLKIAFEYCGKPLPNEDFLREILKVACLNIPLDSPTKMLSGGEKSRLSIARALCLNSDTYLIDEPTSALDSKTQEEVMGNIINYMQNKTLVVVTHSEISAQMCKHIIRLHKGGDVLRVR